jgi:CRP/FNR family cyclic AMP-dependent transcriptional regulator
VPDDGARAGPGLRLPPPHWEAFVASGGRRRYAAGSFLFLEGDPAGAVFGVLRGSVRLAAATDDGRDVVLRLVRRGGLFGELAAIDELPRSASAVAVEETEVVAVTAAAFNRFVEQHPQVAVALLRLLAERVRATTRLHVASRSPDVLRRLASRLDELAAELGGAPGSPVSLQMSHSDLAGWIGTNRETASRALGRLRALELVATGRGRIELLDRRGLAALAASVPG